MSQGLEDKANIADFPNIFNFIHLTGCEPKYLGLESVSFPVMVSIDVLTIIPFPNPAYKYN